VKLGPYSGVFFFFFFIYILLLLLFFHCKRFFISFSLCNQNLCLVEVILKSLVVQKFFKLIVVTIFL
jgi:hypothetical protein